MKRKIIYECLYGDPSCEGMNDCVVVDSGDLDFCPICGHNDIIVREEIELTDNNQTELPTN
jgi:rRNA maturation endonuclease Nob1